jgi:polyketide cyclase/dehydrase/lipid transport protein
VAVDAVSEVEIARAREEVASYAADPDNATAWYRNIMSVEWRSPRPLQVGSRIAFVARFLGRTISYIYEVKEFVPAERLVMATWDGPFAMETTYSWRDSPRGGTTMVLRNRGTPSGFGKMAAPVIAAAIRRANRADLGRLKAIIEG